MSGNIAHVLLISISIAKSCRVASSFHLGLLPKLHLKDDASMRDYKLKMTLDDQLNSDNRSISQSFTLKERNPYDVHVYYDGPSERQAALELREKMYKEFTWMRFYNPKDRPIGPHPVPMWEADFGGYENRHLWRDVRDFVEREHGNLSVLIHPHSIDGDYLDHTKNAFWAGDVLELKIQGWRR